MSGLMKMTVNEMRLFLREPASVFFTVLFPTVLVVILGLIPGFREPNQALGGLRAIDLYVPIAIALSLALLALTDAAHLPEHVPREGYPAATSRHPDASSAAATRAVAYEPVDGDRRRLGCCSRSPGSSMMSPCLSRSSGTS